MVPFIGCINTFKSTLLEVKIVFYSQDEAG